MGRKGDKDQQNVGSQDSAEGKKSADSPFYQFEISGSVAYLSQLNLMLSALGGGLAVGASIKVSEAYGAGDR